MTFDTLTGIALSPMPWVLLLTAGLALWDEGRR